MAALPEDVVSAVASGNFKTVAEMATYNAISHQQRLDILAEKALAKSLESMDTTQVSEGLGLAAANRSDVNKQISELGASISSITEMLRTVANK